MQSRIVSRPSFVFLVTSLATAMFAGPGLAWQDGCVNFDIPSMIPACEISNDELLVDGERLVELVIPVSSMVECRNDQRVQELLIQVRGLGTGLQVADYAPRTQLYSDVDGTIAIEQRQERKSNIGLNANGSAAGAVDLAANLGHGNTVGSSERFQKIPTQKLLLASGTVSRGKGAYFKFRHSPQTTLEGGQEIILKLRVPSSWRGGMLRVDCQASGKEKQLFGEYDFMAGNSSFVVATWLKGDSEARQVVLEYSRLESRLRGFAAAAKRQAKQDRDKDPIGQLLGYHETSTSKLPSNWAERIALFDSRSIRDNIKPYLPEGMQNATDKFLVSRRNVLLLAQ